MLPVRSLLNPTSPAQLAQHYRASPSLSPAWTSSTDLPPSRDGPAVSTSAAIPSPSNYAWLNTKGEVRFPPHEHHLDDSARREVQRFRVSSLGEIQNSPGHIPYNSGKKDFYQKTGRESFEVFQYTFEVAGSDKKFTVMWDYNVGLVRMTPFFKACQYSKTQPSKMLGMNRGLKEITHSITGGSIPAQGYWMPYSCAKAVCATFCYQISGALIPIFGPDFPSLCIPPTSPNFGCMTIDPDIIALAIQEADRDREKNMEERGHPRQSSVVRDLSTASSHGSRHSRGRSRGSMDGYPSSSRLEYRGPPERVLIPHYRDGYIRYPLGPDMSPESAYTYQSQLPPPPMPTSHPWTPPEYKSKVHFGDDDPFRTAHPWLSALPSGTSVPYHRHHPYRRELPTPPPASEQVRQQVQHHQLELAQRLQRENADRAWQPPPPAVEPTRPARAPTPGPSTANTMVDTARRVSALLQQRQPTGDDEDAAELLLNLGVAYSTPPAMERASSISRCSKGKAVETQPRRRSKRTRSSQF